ncbi:STM1 (YLR150W) [Zygosaccharomyces parabailii]|nr:STM1 (YLR150W) [Zygosaccharomyces parabailii]
MASAPNPFDLLGNDVEDPNVLPPKAPREIVKANTSSKKQDVPPPSADPSRARPRPKLTGNEAAIREKTRERNKHRDPPLDTKPKHPKAKYSDRQSRSARTDSHKKEVQGWGDNAKREMEAEEEGERDAKAQEAADAEVDEKTQNTPAKMTLQDYLNEVSSSNPLNKKAEAKKVAPLEDAQLYVKEDEVLVEPTKVKNVKGKQLKSKEYLEFDAKFVDSGRPGRGNGNRGGFSRGGGRGGNSSRGSRSSGPKKVNDSNPVQKNANIDPKNLPSLS